MTMRCVSDYREFYGSREVMQLTGISYSKLDYWARTGVVRPSLNGGIGSGNPRIYSVEDVERVFAALKQRTGRPRFPKL